jgi:hypothetical protein
MRVACLPNVTSTTPATVSEEIKQQEATVTEEGAVEATQADDSRNQPVSPFHPYAETILKAFVMFHLIEGLRHYVQHAGDIIADYELIRYVYDEESCARWLQQHLQQTVQLQCLSALTPTSSAPINPLMIEILMQRRQYLLYRLVAIRKIVFRSLWRVLVYYQARYAEEQVTSRSAVLSAPAVSPDPLRQRLLDYDHSDTRAVATTVLEPSLLAEMYEYSVGIDSCATDVMRCCCCECRCCAAFLYPIACPLRAAYILFCLPCYCCDSMRCRQRGAWSFCRHMWDIDW